MTDSFSSCRSESSIVPPTAIFATACIFAALKRAANRIALLPSLFVAIAVSGCSGHLYTVINPDIGDSKSVQSKKIEGVLAYPVMDVIELYETTVLVDETSKEIIAKSPNCIPERSIKFSTRADYSKPYQIKYEPGLFETNSFSVTLKDGVLASVNTSSDPSKSLSSAAQLLPFIAAPKVATAEVRKKFCNAQQKLLGVFAAPGIRSYDEIPN